MAQAVGVAQFVERLLLGARGDQLVVGGQAVGLGAQAVGGDDRGAAAELGLAEDEGQNRDEEIDGGDPDHPRRAGPGAGQELREQAGRVVLPARGVVGGLGVEPGRMDLDRQGERALEPGGQPPEQLRPPAEEDRHEVDVGVRQIDHPGCRRRYFLILL